MFRVVARALSESPAASISSALFLAWGGRLQRVEYRGVTSERDEYGYHMTSEERSGGDGDDDGDGDGGGLVRKETGVREKSKFLPPQGRELLAAVKLGIPGAQEEFDKQQALLQKRMNVRRKFAEFNRSDGFDGFNLDRQKLFAAKDTLGYYKVMGLEGQEGSASVGEIKAAFRKKAQELHPDVAKGEETAETFRYLVKAYNVLKDPQQRAFYDGSAMY
jgi:hypothetical protein